MILSRELGKRIWGGSTNTENGGGGVSSDAIAGLLTGYAKESWVDEHYISIDFFSRLFQAHGTENGLEIDVMPNDMDTTITSVESMFGFWTNLYISALGSNGAAPAGISLGMLTDVVISGTPSAGQVLTYDVVTQKWVNGNATGASSLATLTDVTISTPQANQFLVYDGSNSRWVNMAIKTINGQSLIGSGDISVGGGASGNYLPLTGGTLVGQLNINENIGTGRNNSPLVINGLNPDTTWNYFLEMWTPAVTNSHNGFVFGNGFSARNCGHLTFVYKGSGSTSNYVAIGMHSVDDSLTVNGWGDVGIGTASASSKLHVENGSITVNNTASTGTIGIAPINVNCTERDSWNFCAKFLSTLSSGNRVGLYTGTSFSARNCGHLTFRSYGSGSTSNYVAIGMHSVDDVLVVCANGNVGVKTSSPSYALHVAGTIYATGAITALSDARKKDIMGETGLSVEQIAHAPAVQFLWKDMERRKDGQQVGTIAQYWQTVLPEVVSDKGGELSMQYGVAALVSAIVTARKVVDHERRIHELEKENERLRNKVEQLRLN